MKYVNLSYSDELLRSAFASKLAYAKGNLKHPTMKIINKHLHGYNKYLSHIWTISSSKGAHVYGYKSGERAYVIAFKGSSSVSDFCTFFDDSIIPFQFRESSIGVHKGVYSMFQSIEQSLSDIIVPMIHVNKPRFITFCGHSLGGSLAMFAAGYYTHLSHGNIVSSCHTFGSPKIGDKSFTTWLTEGSMNVFNIQNHGDVVAWLPFDRKYTSCIPFYIGEKDMNPFKQHDLDTYIDNLIYQFQIQRMGNSFKK